MFGFRRKSVDGVLSALVRAVNQLGDVEREQAELSGKLSDQAFDLLEQAQEATREAVRAYNVRANLSSLLGFEDEAGDDEESLTRDGGGPETDNSKFD